MADEPQDDATRRVETIAPDREPLPPRDAIEEQVEPRTERPSLTGPPIGRVPGRGPASRGPDAGPDPWLRVAGREGGDGSRTSPRMRFDVLQLVAWALGLYFVIAGLIAVARTGFDELELFGTPVEVAGTSATVFYALLMLLVGVVLLAAGTGSVAERRLRIGGVLFGIVGVVFSVEPDAFTEYLGITSESGTTLLAIGLLLVVASFVPPLSIKRPGVTER